MIACAGTEGAYSQKDGRKSWTPCERTAELSANRQVLTVECCGKSCGVNVVQVQRKDRSLRDPREARSRVRSDEALHRNGIAESYLDHVRIFRGVVGPDFLFMDDNAWPPHRSVEVLDTLQSGNILRRYWPSYSPELNHIEYAWDALGRCVAQRTSPPSTVQELKTPFG
ncbi:transposable element Tcb2 transposase [Trichonephila clavipes]|nr:transposable element Tcb2 transposase [Trichonephila clavipes]